MGEIGAEKVEIKNVQPINNVKIRSFADRFSIKPANDQKINKSLMIPNTKA